MASGLQDIPLRRIPKEWDRQWFADFVRDVLRLADARNIKVGPELDLTGQSDEVASLNMSVGGIGLDKIAPQPGLSVIGNPTDSTGALQALVASLDLQVVRRSGLAVGFGVLNATYISDFDEAAQDAVGNCLTDSSSIDFTYDDALGTITAVVLPAGVNHNALANLTTGDPHTQYTQHASAEVISAAWNFTTREQVFGTTTANIALVSALADTGVSIHSVEQTRTHRVAAEPFVSLLRINGSYAAPATLASGDSAGSLTWGGYDGTTIQVQSARIFLDITETWSGTARGADLRFQTTTAGTTTRADRLMLGADGTGAFARLPSGVVTQPGWAFISDADNGFYLIGANNWGAAAGGSKILDIATTGLGVTGALSVTGTITAPSINGTTTLQLQVAGTAQQYMTATQNAWALGTTVPATSTTRHVFGVSGNNGIEIAALAGAPRWVSKRYNGAYATPTKTVNTNPLALFRVEGYQETTGAFVAFSTFDVLATEDFTSTANGHKITFRSVATGSAAVNTTLVLQGTQTQFHGGSVTAPCATFQGDLLSGLYLIGALNVGMSINSTKVFDWSATAATLTTIDLKLASVGKGIYIKEGTNACMGVATLVAGTVVVSTNKVTASSRIFLTVQSLGTVAVPTAVCVTARTAATSFTITSASVTDTSVVAWHILEPA